MTAPPAVSAAPVRRVTLDFRDEAVAAGEVSIAFNLSVCAAAEDTLWVASDETATVERLRTRDRRRYGEHRSFALDQVFDLPEGGAGEMDIEGLSIDGGYLWIVGSHSLARKKPNRHENDRPEALSRLTRIRRDANRYFLGRLPLPAGGGPEGLDPGGVLNGNGAACLKMTGSGGNDITRALARDPHIGRFMEVPSKENGFDVEGLAVRGSRVFLGLRGPVLRGWATVVELDLKTPKPGRLKLRRIGAGGERYRKHFLDLDGLGIRELVFDGDDLLVLAGPTMDLDGPVVLFRWSGALEAGTETVIPQGPELAPVMHLPFGIGCDHAEGIALLDGGNRSQELLVVYDAPSPDRVRDGGTDIDGDVFALPARPKRRSRRHRAAEADVRQDGLPTDVGV